MPTEEFENDWFRKRKERKSHLTAEELYPSLIKGERKTLSAAITLVESSLTNDQIQSKELITKCLKNPKKSWRIGITGVPGVGKSTFIEAFGRIFLEKGLKLAVLAIDPSSNVTGGSILGDKTRMEWLSQQENAFIRPTATGKSLGGVARNTNEAIILCEAAGFDVILIETVGVGQSETLVHSMVDFFLLLMLAGAGDELQGIKRGIMEMADAIIITKADRGNEKMAEMAKVQYKNALHLFPAKESNWIPKVYTCSSVEEKGITEIGNMIESFFNQTINNGWVDENRKNQEVKRLKEILDNSILSEFYRNEQNKSVFDYYKNEVSEGRLIAYQAVEEILTRINKG
jgi:LAO/AO transport system kinase